MSALWTLLIIAVSATAALGNSLLKLGAGKDTGTSSEAPLKLSQLPRAFLRPTILGGVAAYAISQLLWIAVLSQIDLSLAYPLQVGLNFTLIMTVAWAYFKEPLSKGKLVGVGLIFVGILVLAT